MVASNMVLTWGPDCDFIFQTWKTREWPMFYLGVVLSFLSTILATAYGPIFLKQIKRSGTTKWQFTLGFVGEYLLKLYIMLLMMTMNAPVCIAIALGMAIGCTVFGVYGEPIRKKIFGS